jgi:hypothetical protein
MVSMLLVVHQKSDKDLILHSHIAFEISRRVLSLSWPKPKDAVEVAAAVVVVAKVAVDEELAEVEDEVEEE